jgi:hypothetical protein
VNLSSSILDPAGNGLDIADIAQMLAVLVAVSGAVAAVVRWNAHRVAADRTMEREHMELRLKETIEEATVLIKPGFRNGGTSLSDVATQTKTLVERQQDISKDIREIRERLDGHIEWHMEKE